MVRTAGRVAWLSLVVAVLGSSLPRLAVSAQAGTEQHSYLPMLHMQYSRIAFLSNRDGSWGLYTERPDGYGLRYLAPASNESGAVPRWSPDRSRIAFGCADARSICVVWANGSGLPRSFSYAAAGHSPSWSPDGESIAFVCEAGGNSEICVVDVASGVVTNLTQNPAADIEPDRSPDGELIAFVSDRSGFRAAHTMRSVGSQPHLHEPPGTRRLPRLDDAIDI